MSFITLPFEEILAVPMLLHIKIGKVPVLN
jgi:hypothetical protein